MKPRRVQGRDVRLGDVVLVQNYVMITATNGPYGLRPEGEVVVGDDVGVGEWTLDTDTEYTLVSRGKKGKR